jgi:hypothetical protein
MGWKIQDRGVVGGCPVWREEWTAVPKWDSRGIEIVNPERKF